MVRDRAAGVCLKPPNHPNLYQFNTGGQGNGHAAE
jgi:hypothetical protein